MTDKTNLTDEQKTIAMLERKLQIAKRKEVEMDFQIQAVQDMSRVQITADIVAGYITHHGRVNRSVVDDAMEVAEYVMDGYNDIVQERKTQYADAIEKLDMEEATNKATNKEH